MRTDSPSKIGTAVHRRQYAETKAQGIPEVRRHGMQRLRLALSTLRGSRGDLMPAGRMEPSLKHNSKKEIKDGEFNSGRQAPAVESDGEHYTFADALRVRLQTLERALALNAPPDIPTLDIERLTQAEGARRPELNLTFLRGPTPLSALLIHLRDTPTHHADTGWQAVISDGTHSIAASVRHAPGNPANVSAVFIESLHNSYINPQDYVESEREIEQSAMRTAFERKGVRVSAQYLFTSAQKGEGCAFFSLSAAKYMSSSERVSNLHEQGLARLSFDRSSKILEMRSLDFKPSIEPQFFKHATSLRVVQEYLERNPEWATTRVNKKGQTLEERVRAHMVRRRSPDLDNWREYSNSIEHKRIAVYKRTLESLTVERELATEYYREMVARDESAQVERLLDALMSSSNTPPCLDMFSDAAIGDERFSDGSALVHRLVEAEWMNAGTTFRLEQLCARAQVAGIGLGTLGKDGLSVLHHAVSYTWEPADAVSTLLRQGVDPNGRTHVGMTPLHLASDRWVIEELLEHGADPNARAANGESVLEHQASEHPLWLGTCIPLISNGADITDRFVDAVHNSVPEETRSLVPVKEAERDDWLSFLKSQFTAEVLAERDYDDFCGVEVLAERDYADFCDSDHSNDPSDE